MQKGSAVPLVSVIIPTCNSEKTIGQCLQSISKQTYKRTEPLVVDCYSRDKTARIAKQFNAKVLQLKGERSEAKNYAAKKALGGFLLFIDSDMTLEPGTIEECVRECMENGVDGIVIPERYVGFGSIGECRKAEKSLLSNVNGLVDIPRFFKKDIFLKLGGFDEKLVCGEDFHLFQRFKNAGFQTAKTEAKIQHYEGSPTLFQVASKGYDYGKTIPHLVDKRPGNIVKRYSDLRLVSLRKIGSQIRSLRLLLVFVFMKTVEFLAYFSGIYSGMINKSLKTRLQKLVAVLQRNRYAIIALTSFTLISLIIFRNFFFANGLPAGNDLYGWISREYIYARDFRWLYIWRPYSFGFVEGVNLLDLFFLLTHVLFTDAVVTIEVFLFLSFLLAGFSMYAFAWYYTRNHLAGFSAALIYTLNQWFFSQITEGHVDIIFSYAFAPLLFLLVDRALRTAKPKNIILSAMAMMVFVTGFHANSVVIYGVFLILFVSMYLFFPSRNEKIVARSKKFLKFLSLCGIVAILLTAFYTLPFFMNVKAFFLTAEYKYQIEEAEFFSARNLTEAFALGATEEGGYMNVVDVRSGFGVPDFPVQAFLFAVFLIAYSAIIVRRDRYTMFFLVATIISIFISKGSNPPLGTFFTWAWFNVPYFAVFRRPNRWEMITAFSNAFFVALFVSLVFNYITKRSTATRENLVAKNSKISQPQPTKESGNAINIPDKWIKSFRKLFRFIGVTLIVMMLLTGLVSCWYFFYNSLLTYKIAKDDVKPFYWIAGQPGNYKIITVNKSPAEWASDPWAGTDFAFSRMMTEIGWAHDIGFDSSLIHDKTVLQDGGWEPTSKLFVDYLRRGLVYNNMTDDFLKILGSFSYKYVVIPSYASERVKEFILNQEGGHIIYNENDSLIIENDYFTPQFFSPKNLALVIGGLECLPLMCNIDSFKLNETALVFTNSDAGHFPFDDTLNSSAAIVFANGPSFLDIVSPFISDAGVLILARNYAVPSENVSKYWVASTFWRDSGKLVLGEETLTTRGKCRAGIPFAVNSDGEYEIWIRIAFGPDRGELSLYVDDEFVGKLATGTKYWTVLKWVKIAVSKLNQGSHLLTLGNDGSGYNDVDALCIAEESSFHAKLADYLEELQSFDGRLIYMLRPEDFLDGIAIPRWEIASQPYEGNILVGDNALTDVSLKADANASSTQSIPGQSVEARFVADGNLASRWASAPYQDPPQWVELNWASQHEIATVRIFFETAYAQDYLIQTWNSEESAWIAQINVTGNDQLVRLHFLETPVNTTRLRIYVTKFDGFQMVSIYEVESYEKSVTTSAMLFAPRDETYRCFVRADSESEAGKIYLKLDENASEISIPNNSGKYQWFEAGDFNLSVGEHRLGLGTLGRVGISQILLCSLLKNESNPLLSELFASNASVPAIAYERVNPCTYQLEVSANEPFFLVFSESYNPLWKVLLDGEEISSTPVYSFLNGFFVNKTGNFTMVVYFTGQTYVDIGLKIASISFLFALAVILTPSKVFRKIARKLKRSKKGQNLEQ